MVQCQVYYIIFNRHTEIACNVMYGFLQIYNNIMIVTGIESGPMPKL